MALKTCLFVSAPPLGLDFINELIFSLVLIGHSYFDFLLCASVYFKPSQTLHGTNEPKNDQFLIQTLEIREKEYRKGFFVVVVFP